MKHLKHIKTTTLLLIALPIGILFVMFFGLIGMLDHEAGKVINEAIFREQRRK